jgi:hypothetical protein
MSRSETAEEKNSRAIDEVLEYVRRMSRGIDRGLEKVARTTPETPVLPGHQKPARPGGAPPAERVIPSRRPSSIGEDVPVDPRAGSIRKMTVASAALALSEQLGRPLDSMQEQLARLVDLALDDGLTFDQALSQSRQEIADGVRRGMR